VLAIVNQPLDALRVTQLGKTDCRVKARAVQMMPRGQHRRIRVTMTGGFAKNRFEEAACLRDSRTSERDRIVVRAEPVCLLAALDQFSHDFWAKTNRGHPSRDSASRLLHLKEIAIEGIDLKHLTQNTNAADFTLLVLISQFSQDVFPKARIASTFGDDV
jgi:hypothetical protein